MHRLPQTVVVDVCQFGTSVRLCGRVVVNPAVCIAINTVKQLKPTHGVKGANAAKNIDAVATIQLARCFERRSMGLLALQRTRRHLSRPGYEPRWSVSANAGAAQGRRSRKSGVPRHRGANSSGRRRPPRDARSRARSEICRGDRRRPTPPRRLAPAPAGLALCRLPFFERPSCKLAGSGSRKPNSTFVLVPSYFGKSRLFCTRSPIVHVTPPG